VPPTQAPDLRAAILSFLEASRLDMVDKAQASREFAHARTLADTLPEPSRTLMTYVNNRDVVHLGPILVPHLTALSGDDALSPDHGVPPACVVYLLHGVDDNVIPAIESALLARTLRERRHRPLPRAAGDPREGWTTRHRYRPPGRWCDSGVPCWTIEGVRRWASVRSLGFSFAAGFGLRRAGVLGRAGDAPGVGDVRGRPAFFLSVATSLRTAPENRQAAAGIRDRANRDAAQPNDGMTNRFAHLADLAVAPFVDHHRQHRSTRRAFRRPCAGRPRASCGGRR
jgi:hypothetical protein